MSDTIGCPHCGAEIRSDARFCRHCGSSDEDGWRDEEDVGDEEFDYDQYVADNFPSSNYRTGTKPLWRIVAVVLLVLFFLGFLFF